MSSLFRLAMITLGTLFLIPFAYTQASNFPPVNFFEAGQLSVPQTNINTGLRICNFTNGGYTSYGPRGDVAVFNAESDPLWSAANNDGGTRAPSPSTDCLLSFGLDGNLISTFQGRLLWNSGTEGRGMWLVCSEISPWLWIVDGAGTVIWSTSSS